MNKKKNILLQIEKIVREFKIPSGESVFSKKTILALDGVSLKVKYGESFGIVGESGSGKSTLAKTILGLETPQSGEIFFKGENIHSLSPKDLRRIRRGLQMIFQDPYGSLNPKQTINNIISEPLALFEEIKKEQIKNKVREALEKVGLSPNDINKYPHEFSGGQRQRIAIARALITKPSLIVADEPVSALDVSIRAQVLNLMMDLREEHGLAYLFISHDLSIVRQTTSKIAVMYNGKIVETGSTENLFNNPLHPYTNSLIKAIPRLDPIRKIRKHKTSNLRSHNLLDSGRGCSYASNCPNVMNKCINNLPKLKKFTRKRSKAIYSNSTNETHEVACHYPIY